MRSIWSGAISFGLIYVPVKLYSGSEEQTLDFDMLRKGDLCPIRYVRACESDGEEVEYKEIVKGSLKIFLRGQKLKGAFALSKMQGGKEENAWLLVKKQDDFATPQDVLLWDRSVLSGRDMAGEARRSLQARPGRGDRPGGELAAAGEGGETTVVTGVRFTE